MRTQTRHARPRPADELESRGDALFLAFSLGLLALTLVLSLAFLV